jgi:hypothetical protein
MALTYETKVNTVRVKKNLDGLQNVITRVFYTVLATAEDGYKKRFNLELQFDDQVNPESFVDISQVDEPTLVGWITAHPRYLPVPENIILDLIQFERDKEYIEDYPFPFLEPIRYDM